MALKELLLHAGPAGADALAAAAARAYEDLAAVVAPLIGQAGVVALTGRAVHLARQDYPWLGERDDPQASEHPFAAVVACLARQERTVAAEAAAAVLARMCGLLVTFIGEPLTTQLLRRAWPDGVSAERAEGHEA